MSGVMMVAPIGKNDTFHLILNHSGTRYTACGIHAIDSRLDWGRSAWWNSPELDQIRFCRVCTMAAQRFHARNAAMLNRLGVAIDPDRDLNR